MKKYSIILLVLICVACSNGGTKGGSSDSSAVTFGSVGGTFKVEGTLSNGSGQTLYIEEMTPDNGPQFIDSIRCDKSGHFKFEGKMDYQTFFNLHSGQFDYIVLLPHAGESITVTGDCKKLSETYMVKGSPESQLMWQIQNHINEANRTIADIAQQDQQNKATLKKADYEAAHKVTDSIFIAEHQMIYLTFKQFIEDNSGSLSTLYALDAPFNHTGRIFYAENDFDIFENVLAGLQSVQPDNPHTVYFQTRMERTRSARMMAIQQQQEQQEANFTIQQ